MMTERSQQKKADFSDGSCPSSVTIELVRGCPLSCRMCFVPVIVGRKARYMSMRTVRAILPYLDRVHTLGIGGYGEPLLHPRLTEILAAAKRQNNRLRTWIITNGMPLTLRLMDQLIDERLDSLRVSVDAADSRIYEAIRAGASFSRVRRVLALLARRKTRAHSTVPAVTLMFVALKSTAQQILPLIDFAASYGVPGIAVLRPRAYSPGVVNDLWHPAERGKLRALLARADVRARRHGVRLFTEGLVDPVRECAAGSDMTISYAGEVSPCCFRMIRKTVCSGTNAYTVPSTVWGNVRATPLDRLWSRPARAAFYRRIREERSLPDACAYCR